MKYLSTLCLLTALIPGISVIGVSCSENSDSHESHELHDHDHDHETESKSSAHPENESSLLTVHIEDDDAELLGILTDTIRESSFRPAITVAGEISSSTSRAGIVVAPTSGVIRIPDDITVGSRVVKGGKIAAIDASVVGGSDRQTEAEARLRAAREEYERLKPLLDRGLITATQLNQAREAYELAKAAISPAASSRSATTPVEGVVTALLTPNGSYVEAGQPIASVSGSGKLNLKVSVPDRHATFLSGLSGAIIHPAGIERSIDIEDYNGQFATGGSTTSINGYIPVACTFDNPGLPGGASSVSVDLLGTPVNGVIAVPREAVINDQGYTFVYLATEPEHYIKTPVTTGRTDGKRWEITSGIKAGDRIVSAGAPMVRMAQNQAIPVEGHNHNH